MAKIPTREEMQERIRSAQAAYEAQLARFLDAATAGEQGEALQALPALKEGPAMDKAMALLRDPSAPAEIRALVPPRLVSAAAGSEDTLLELLSLLGDAGTPALLRRALFRALKALEFSSPLFPALRPAWMNTLRSLLDDGDAELRTLAAEALAQHKDELVQTRLKATLKGEGSALVPQALAIQFLGYDDHGDYFPLVRELLQRPGTDRPARMEAVHVLARDPGSGEVLAGLMGDAGEDAPLRMASASALRVADPQRFLQHARTLVLDDKAPQELRSALLNGLMQQREAGTLFNDPDFLQRLEQLRTRTPSPELKKMSGQFLDKAAHHIRKQ